MAYIFTLKLYSQYNRFTDPDILQIEIASVTGMATARGVAKTFGILANGGKHENKTLLSKAIIDEYVNDDVPPAPDYLLYGHQMRWKYAMDIVPQGENVSRMFMSLGKVVSRISFCIFPTPTWQPIFLNFSQFLSNSATLLARPISGG